MEWNLIQACTAGRSHRRLGTPCQDAAAVRQSPDGSVCAIALADGAGSQALSHYGAQTVTRTVTRLLCEQFDAFYACPDAGAVRQTILNVLLEALRETGSVLQCPPEALASTLLFAACKGDRFLLGHIGDGVIGGLDNGQLRVLSSPTNGEFLNATCFVTSPHAARHFRLFKAEKPAFGAIVLLSDGSEQALYQRRGGTLTETVRDLLRLGVVLPPKQFQPQVQSLLDGPVAAATGDDCSLVLMARPTPAFPGFLGFSAAEQRALLELPADRPGDPRRLRTTVAVLKELQTRPCRPAQLARRLHLHPKRVQRILTRLERTGCAVRDGGSWTSPLR